MATPEETDVVVTERDFVSALSELVPSVSLDDIRHYETVRQKFASETLNSEKQVNGEGSANGIATSQSKGKGKARA
jgi:peroxin-6